MSWEVRIMPFEISSSEKKGWFSPALFKKNLSRFWPLVVGYGVIQFFLLPMSMVAELSFAVRNGRDVGDRLASTLTNATIWAVPLGVVFGLLAAMALFFYLMNGRSSGMLHALPIRREGLFLTNWLSGLTFFLVPNMVVYLIALAVEVTYGGVQLGLSLRWFALHTVVAMFFFCFAVCCAMFTGHILALPVFYGVLNGLVAGLCMLIDEAIDVLLVGYAGNSLFYSDLTRWCTPLWHIASKIQDMDLVAVDAAGREVNYITSMGGHTWVYRWAEGTSIALGYCLVLGAAFTLIAVIAYQHRQLERAGDVVTVGWARPIFQWGVGICTGLVLGTAVYEEFFRRLGPWVFVALVALFTVVGAFVARMFLKKTLRVFAEGWKSCIAVGLTMLLLLGGARADFFGYQRWTPDPNQVESVYLGNLQTAPYDSGRSGVTLTDPELVAQAVAIHQGLVKDLKRLEEMSRNGIWYSTSSDGDWETAGATRVRIEYAMKDGGYETRWYTSVPVSEETLADSGSYAAQLEALLNQPEVQRQRYMGWLVDQQVTAAAGWLSYIQGESREAQLTTEQTQILWTAFLEDLNAGRIHCYLLDGKERMDNCYYTDMEFTLSYTRHDPETGKRETGTSTLSVTLQKSATSMMAVLEREGLRDLLVSRDTEKFPETFAVG